MKPFLKWAGGKRWLFESGQFAAPTFEGRYIEPFVGGGAVFFEIMPERAILADANIRLIELYQVIRDDCKTFEKLLKTHASMHSKDYYYLIRSRKCQTPHTRAAQFLYLNRTCWNGLYRENKKGEFNVPIGTKDSVLFASDDFDAWSEALSGVDIVHRDFEKTIDQAKEGDFLFVDPPYTVRHNMNGFVKYNQTIFAWEDQIRLKNALQRAATRGANFVMTNADHESIRDLYSGFGVSTQLARNSVIAGSSQHRSRSTELMIAG